MTTDVQGDLFPDLPPTPAPGTGRPAPPHETDSYTVRLTRRRNHDIARGIHPTTGLRILDTNETCGTCAHAFSHSRTKTYWKCNQVDFTFGPSSDIRLSWPACTRWAART